MFLHLFYPPINALEAPLVCDVVDENDSLSATRITSYYCAKATLPARIPNLVRKREENALKIRPKTICEMRRISAVGLTCNFTRLPSSKMIVVLYVAETEVKCENLSK